MMNKSIATVRRLVVALALTGCGTITGPDVRYMNRRPMGPVPAIYAEWYAATEACLGLRGDFAAVGWFVADSIIGTGEFPTWGTLDWPHDITIVYHHRKDSRIVRHESAHHITGMGDALHTDDGRRAVCDE